MGALPANCEPANRLIGNRLIGNRNLMGGGICQSADSLYLSLFDYDSQSTDFYVRRVYKITTLLQYSNFTGINTGNNFMTAATA